MSTPTPNEAPLLFPGALAMPALGLGTWQLKGDAGERAVAHALSTGYRHLDTASAYENEREVGAGLRASGLPRERVFVTTKVWHSDLADGAVQRSAEASLKRLGLDYVDLLLVHWPSKTVALAETLAAFAECKRRGLTRHIGVANFTVPLLAEAVALSREPIAANQCEYHPRLDQTKVLAACRRHGIVFTSYCPIGRMTLLHDPTVVAIALEKGRTPAQILLRWHIQQGIAAIPKSGHGPRIDENMAIFDFALSDDEMARLHGLARADGRMIDLAFSPLWDVA